MIDRLYKSTPIIHTTLAYVARVLRRSGRMLHWKETAVTETKRHLIWNVSWVEWSLHNIFKNNSMRYLCYARIHTQRHSLTFYRTWLAFVAWCEIADVRFLCVFYCLCCVWCVINHWNSKEHASFVDFVCVQWSDESINSNALNLINIFLQHLRMLFPFILSSLFFFSFFPSF